MVLVLPHDVAAVRGRRVSERGGGEKAKMIIFLENAIAV